MMRKPVASIISFIAIFAFSCVLFAQEAPKTLTPEADKEVAPQVEVAKEAPKPAISPAQIMAANLIKKAQQKISTVKDYTCEFNKQEFVKGKMYPKEQAQLKFRMPHSVYMKWTGKEHKGQEVLFVKGKNKNKIKAHEGGWLSAITVNLDPHGSMAMKGNRHPITEAGFSHTIGLIAKDFKRIKDNPDHKTKITDKGTQKIHGATSQCFEAELPKKDHPEYYAYKVHICVDKKLNLPNKVQIWDFEKGKVRLVEDYSYGKIKVNVGLTDKDFDPDNKEYKF